MFKRGWGKAVFSLILVVALSLLFGCASQQPKQQQTGSTAAPKSATPAETPKSATPAKTPEKPAAPPEKAILSVSDKSLSFLPHYLAVDKGFFKEEGLEVEIAVMKSDLQIAALTEGQIDFLASMSVANRAIAKGMPMKAILAVYDRPMFFLMGLSDLAKVADLKGKAIGVSRIGATSHAEAELMLADAGLDPKKDVTFVGTGATATSVAALQSKAIQAAIVSTPFNVTLAKEGYKELARVSDRNKRPFTGIVVADKKIAEKPDQVRRAARAMLKALQYAHTNKQGTVEYIVKEWQLDQAVAQDVYQSVIQLMIPNGTVSPEGIELDLKYAQMYEALEKVVPADKIINTTILQQARQELNIK